MWDISDKKLISLKTARTYFIFAVITAVFGAVYEIFSHEVYSYFMIYAFAFPLAGGTLPYLLIGLSKKVLLPPKPCRYLYNSAVAALTVGSIFKGILDIYGTTSPLTKVYWISATVLFLLSINSYILSKNKTVRNV